MIETSILVLAKNEAQNIGSCLKAIYSQKYAGPVEVIVVDSGSTDETLEIARRYPARIEQIPAESFHHARTRNYAATLASGEVLIYLAADATPTSDTWLEAMVSNFADPSVGAVYGQHLPKPGSSLERQHTLNAMYGNERIVKEPCSREKLGYRYYTFSTVNAGIRRNVWQSTPFPENLKVFEDLGIAKSILEAGHKIVYEPQAAVYHSHNHTTIGLFKRYFDLGVTFNRLEIWNDRTRSSMLQALWQLLRRKLARFEGNRSSLILGKSIRQDLAKSAGLFLGLHERYLPLALKRRSSAFHLFE
jgi:glycosyltransferase involved in cell wall biosynthesis